METAALSPPPDVAHLVALLFMTSETSFLGHQGVHGAHVLLAHDDVHRVDIIRALLEGFQGSPLPLVGSILGAEGIETGDVRHDPEIGARDFVCLPGHVGGIDEGELHAGSGHHVALRNARQIGVGLGFPCNPDVDAAVHGVPAAVNDVFFVGNPGLNGGLLQGDDAYLADVPGEGKGDDEGPGCRHGKDEDPEIEMKFPDPYLPVHDRLSLTSFSLREGAGALSPPVTILHYT
jgi:hypothetical protein